MKHERLIHGYDRVLVAFVMFALTSLMMAHVMSDTAYAQTDSGELAIIDTLDAPQLDSEAYVTDMESRVVALVTHTLLQYESIGPSALEAVADTEATAHDPFVFVLNATTAQFVAYPDLRTVPNAINKADRPLSQIFTDLSEDGGTWVNHMSTNPDTGIVQQKRSWLYAHDGYIFGAGYYLHDTEVQSLADGAVRLYIAHGNAAFDAITPDHAVTTNDNSVFVIDSETGRIVAHQTDPSLVDTVSDTFLYKSGKSYEQVVADLGQTGHAWVSYAVLNPDAGTQQTARVWLQMHGGYIFASGYNLPDSRIQSLVEGAQLLYQSNGQSAFDILTPATADDTGILYPYVLDAATGAIVAHGISPHFDAQTDTLSEETIRNIMADLQKDGHAWMSHTSLPSHDSNTVQVQRTYAQLHDGYIFASGYSLPDSRVQAIVDLAVHAYRTAGDDVFDTIDGGNLSINPVLYPFVLSKGGAVVASAAPDAIINQLYGLHVTSDRDAPSIFSDVVKNQNTWLERVVVNAATDTEQTMRMWLYLYDDYIFGAGYYIPDSEVQLVVDHAILTYRSIGQEAAFDTITPAESLAEPYLYPFVVDAESLVLKAHGAFPHRVGACCFDPLRQTGDRELDVVLDDLYRDGGTWVWYNYTNPGTSTTQEKRAWLSLFDGHIFGSGYYIRDSHAQAIVRNTIFAYDSGTTFDDINALQYDIGRPYPFILDPADATIVAHGANPLRVGDVSAALTAADRSMDAILADLENFRGTWVQYTTINPETGSDDTKRSWLSLHDGYVFGSGYYDIGAFN